MLGGTKFKLLELRRLPGSYEANLAVDGNAGEQMTVWSRRGMIWYLPNGDRLPPDIESWLSEKVTAMEL